MAAEKKPKKPAAKKPAGEKKPRASKKPKAAPGSAGISAADSVGGVAPAEITALEARVAGVGGKVVGHYREPLGGHWVVLAVLPIDQVEPTPYQRELSKAHADRLAMVIPKVGRFLDPIVTVPTPEGFRSPNGMHRLSAMRALGAQAITALIVPEPEVAFRILALNTEKAHNLRDKSLEVVRMVRALAEDPVAGKRPESDYQLELEQPAYLTIGICYEQNGRFSGGAYLPVVNKCEEWSDRPLRDIVAGREAHARKLLELDEAVNAAVTKLKEAGFQSGYLKPVVVARINPLRWIKVKPGQPIRADFDKTLDKMLDAARAFDASKVKAADIAAAASMGGTPEE
jgi:ParB family chromosome partitioning protein